MGRRRVQCPVCNTRTVVDVPDGGSISAVRQPESRSRSGGSLSTLEKAGVAIGFMTLPIWGAATADTTYERRAVVCPNHHDIVVVIERQRDREASAPPPTDQVEEGPDDVDSTSDEPAAPIGPLSIGAAVLLIGWFIVLPVAAFDGTISLLEGAAFAVVAVLALLTAIHPFFLVLLLVPSFFFGLAYLTYLSTDGMLSIIFSGLWVLFGLLFFLPIIAPKRLVRLLPPPPDS